MTKEQEELRNHFAGQAMAAQIIAKGPGSSRIDFIATKSYEYADAMLKESGLNQAPKKKWNMRMTRLGPD